MKAANIKTQGMYCNKCCGRIESALRRLRGVRDVHAFQMIALTSVLYDSDVVDEETIRKNIAKAGFTTVHRQQHAH